MSFRFRSGCVAEKLGMTHIYNELGNLIPVTLVKISRNKVLSIKDYESFKKVLIGYGHRKASKVLKPIRGIFAKYGEVENPFYGLKEFRVSAHSNVNVGDEISSTSYKKGQKIDVTGISHGKGFAGVMKRHNFSGLEASHGVSVSHRSHGSTGQRQDPGKVFKGKKMAGHMGDVRVTVQNLEVVQVSDDGIIAIKGAIPGYKGSIIYLNDAIKS